MTARIVYGLLACGSLVCAGSLGFVAGYSSSRNPVEDPDTKQLLLLADKIAIDVIGIQRTLAQGATQCPAASIASQPIAASSAEVAQAKERAPIVAAVDDAQQRAHAEAAEAIVMRGVSSGRWTDDDARNLRAAMSELSSNQKQSIIIPLLQAINSQRVKLEVEHGVL